MQGLNSSMLHIRCQYVYVTHYVRSSICPIFDFNMSISTSVNEASHCVALVESTEMIADLYMYVLFILQRMYFYSNIAETVMLFPSNLKGSFQLRNDSCGECICTTPNKDIDMRCKNPFHLAGITHPVKYCWIYL